MLLRIRLLMILMSMAALLLLGLQGYWLVSLYDHQQQRLQQQVQDALLKANEQALGTAVLSVFSGPDGGMVVSRKQILLQLWGDDSFFHGRSLDVFIAKLRQLLRQDSALTLITHRGEGYRLVCPQITIKA